MKEVARLRSFLLASKLSALAPCRGRFFVANMIFEVMIETRFWAWNMWKDVW